MSNAILGKKIKNLREFNGLTQKELGELLNYSEAHISHIESGNRSLGINDIKTVANRFHVSIDNLVGSNSSVKFRSEKINDDNAFLSDDMLKDFIDYARKQ